MSRKRSWWGDTRRVEVGEHHRDGGVVELDDEVSTDDFKREDLTKPHHIDLDNTPPGDPVTTVQFLELWDRVDTLKIGLERAKRGTANRIMKAMGDKPPAEVLRNLKFKVNIIWAALALALTTAGASLKSVITYVGDAREEAVTIRHLIDQNNDLSGRLRAAEDMLTRSVQRLDDMMHPRGNHD